MTAPLSETLTIARGCSRDQDWLAITDQVLDVSGIPRLVTPEPGFYGITDGVTVRTTRSRFDPNAFRGRSEVSGMWRSPDPRSVVEVIEITGDPSVPGSVLRRQVGTPPTTHGNHPAGAEVEPWAP
jgi:hypothetical protein